jgi:hypothetical protein
LAAGREARAETGLDIPLPLFQQVRTYEDLEKAEEGTE